MYLHLGQDTLANTGEIVGLFDLDTTTLSERSREFLNKAEKAGRVRNVSTELPKSFVVCEPAAKRRRGQGSHSAHGGELGQRQNGVIYISQLGTATLKKRLEARRTEVF